MNALNNRVRYSEGDVTPFAVGMGVSNLDYSGFMLKDLSDFVGAQIP